MKKYKRNLKIDYSQFKESNNNLKTKYGLPRNINFCQKCVISNQRPNSCLEFNHTKESHKESINLGEKGICDACKKTEKKEKEIDWQERKQELIELCDEYRKNDGSYDCLIPGSGGKDSFYAVSGKDKYRLANVDYNGIKISAIIRKENLYGCQFHSEKSGEVGLNIIRNFINL